MFGAICAGHPVQTNLQTLSATQFVFTLPSHPSFHHLVVFLLPDAVLPASTGAAVYIQLSASAAFTLLGHISPTKPSAIFKISRPDDDSPAITLGISLEPLDALTATAAPTLALVAAKSAPSSLDANATALLAQKIIEDAFNFLASFGVSTAEIRAGKEVQGGGEVVPLARFREWWGRFEGRVRADPGFLLKGGG